MSDEPDEPPDVVPDVVPEHRRALPVVLVAGAVAVLVVGVVAATVLGGGGGSTTVDEAAPATTAPAVTGDAGSDPSGSPVLGDPDDLLADLPGLEGTAPDDTTAPVVDEGDGSDTVTVFDLAVGDCWNDPPDIEDEDIPLGDLQVVDCDLPHDNEVFATFTLPDGDYDADATQEAARLGCLVAFEPYVGTAHEDSDLDLFALWPRAESWAFGDREVVCSLYDIDLVPLLGTMRGSGR